MFNGLTFFGIEIQRWMVYALLRLTEGIAILTVIIMIAVYIWYKIDEKKKIKNVHGWLEDK